MAACGCVMMTQNVNLMGIECGWKKGLKDIFSGIIICGVLGIILCKEESIF